MKANELRIGNWVINDSGEQQQVVCIPIQYNEYNYFQPIPITEEWMLKFQFGKKDIDGTICFAIQLPLFGGYSFINIMHSDGRTYVHLTQMDFGDTINNIIELDYKIEYVHQLQNLYFALTGQEL